MGCTQCSENQGKNKHINKNDKRNKKGNEFSLLSDQNNTVYLHSKSSFISESCNNNTDTNNHLEKLEEEIS